VLNGKVQLSESQVRAFGLMWLVLGVAFVGCAALLFLGIPRWPSATIGVALTSALMCIAFWPEARIGLFLNVAILILVLSGLLS
jgi:hypothetical protein